jgi:hypothetical protein
MLFLRDTLRLGSPTLAPESWISSVYVSLCRNSLYLTTCSNQEMKVIKIPSCFTRGIEKLRNICLWAWIFFLFKTCLCLKDKYGQEQLTETILYIYAKKLP